MHHRAGAAVALAAPELASREAQVVAEDGQEAIFGIALNAVAPAVYAQDVNSAMTTSYAQAGPFYFTLYSRVCVRM